VKKEEFKPRDVIPPAPWKQTLPPQPPTDLAQRIQRTTIHGADVLVCPTSAKDIVCARISLPAGASREANRALAHLTFDMTERGTTKHDKFTLAGMFEGAGIDVESTITADTVETTAKCLSRDLPLLLSLILEQWRMPSFKPDEFKKAKTDMISTLQQQLEDTDEQAAIAFSRATRAEGDPLRRSTIPEMTTFARQATLEAVKAFHARHYGPRGLRIVLVGDVNPKEVQEQLAGLLAGWTPQSGTPAPLVPPVKLSRTVTVPMADKSSVSVVLGQPSGLKAGDDGWLALRVANEVLGNGFTSRLIGNVRDREGLTYSIGSSIADDSERPGIWTVQASFAPAMLDQGLASMQREIEHWWRDGITAEELAFRKTATAGEFMVGLETTSGLAEQILQCIRRGFDLKWLDEYPAKLNALTRDDVNRVLQQQLDPGTVVLVKAGVPK
jgi:zinc protease